MRKANDLLVHDVHAPGKDVYNNAFDTIEDFEDYLKETFNGMSNVPDDFIYALEDVKKMRVFPFIVSENSNASYSVRIMYVDENTTDDEISDFIHRNS